MRARTSPLLFMQGALLGLAATGCNYSDGRQAVVGTVTLDDRPLISGGINFRPQGHQTNGSGATVRDGKFEIPAGKGLFPGTYQVTVMAFRETGKSLQDPLRGAVPELEQVRFSNGEQEIVVSEGSENRFSIDLDSQK